MNSRSRQSLFVRSLVITGAVMLVLAAVTTALGQGGSGKGVWRTMYCTGDSSQINCPTFEDCDIIVGVSTSTPDSVSSPIAPRLYYCQSEAFPGICAGPARSTCSSSGIAVACGEKYGCISMMPYNPPAFCTQTMFTCHTFGKQ